MNGIKEDIKSIIVLDSGKPTYQEALLNLSKRLKTLLVCILITQQFISIQIHTVWIWIGLDSETL